MTSHGAGAPTVPTAGACLDLVDRSRSSLLQACRTTDAGERYVEAHLGALRAAAALLAARSVSSSGRGPAVLRAVPRSRPRSVWELLPRVAPELTEWSAFFAASARRRAVVERGGCVTSRESDDLLRQAENFLEIVQDLLGLPRDEALAPITRYVAPVAPVSSRVSGGVSGGVPGGVSGGVSRRGGLSRGA